MLCMDTCGDLLGDNIGHHLILACYQFARFGVVIILKQESAGKSFCKADYLSAAEVGIAVINIIDVDAVGAVAILLADDNILRNVDKTAGQITRVSRSERGIGKTFTGAAGGNEVFEYIKTFTVVSSDGNLYRLTCGVGDKSAHTCKLTKL